YAGVIMFVTSSAVKHDKPTGKAGVVDHAGIVHISPGEKIAVGKVPERAKGTVDAAVRMAEGAGPAGRMVKGLLEGTEFVRFEDEEKALAALSRKEVGAVFVIPEDYVATGKVISYDASTSLFSEGKEY